jgi:hypothetical protein
MTSLQEVLLVQSSMPAMAHIAQSVNIAFHINVYMHKIETDDHGVC